MNVAFSGHRNFDKSKYEKKLRGSLVSLIERGYSRFFSGMACGFDLVAAEQLIALRDVGFAVELIAVIPFSRQSERYSYSNRQRYTRVLSHVDKQIVLSEEYSKEVFFLRNDFLIEQADYILAYYDGSKTGGTAYTLRQARRAKIPCENIFLFSQLTLF